MVSFSSELYVNKKVKFDDTGEPVGSGGFGAVYKGQHPIHGEVALKHIELRNVDKERVLKLISAEVKAWKSLSHPHILEFLGLYDKKGKLYMVSPWVEHGSLVTYLGTHPNADRTQFIRETADALSYLHGQNIIHGDIKGPNILVSSTIHALLCDFGLSRSIDDETQSQLKGGGSHRWMAPEIWEEQPKSFASDMFSFGMTIYEILSGNKPFFHIHESYAVLPALKRGERPPRQPETASDGTSYTFLWHIAEECWSTMPEARPSADNVLQDLWVSHIIASERSDNPVDPMLSLQPASFGTSYYGMPSYTSPSFNPAATIQSDTSPMGTSTIINSLPRYGIGEQFMASPTPSVVAPPLPTGMDTKRVWTVRSVAHALLPCFSASD